MYVFFLFCFVLFCLLYIDCNQPDLVQTIRISEISQGKYLFEEIKRKRNGLRNYSRDYPHGKQDYRLSRWKHDSLSFPVI